MLNSTNPMRWPATLVSLLLGLSAFTWLSSAPFAQVNNDPEPIRVACVGDSITQGNASPDAFVHSWPLLLQGLFDLDGVGKYQVGNFGKGGATLLRGPNTPYLDQVEFERSKDYQPQIVIINLGINDCNHGVWTGDADEFRKGLEYLIGVYEGLESKPVVWLSSLCRMYPAHEQFDATRPFRETADSVIRAVAKERGLGLLDFQKVTTGVENLYPDGLHPNTAGGALLAQEAFTGLTGKPAKDVSWIRPPVLDLDEKPVQRLVVDGNLEQGEPGHGEPVQRGSWQLGDGYLEGQSGQDLLSGFGVGTGDFHMTARLRMIGQAHSAATFFMGGNHFGFDGAKGTVFRRGPEFGQYPILLHRSELLWERDAWIHFEVIRKDGLAWFVINGFVVEIMPVALGYERIGFDPMRSRMQISGWTLAGDVIPLEPAHAQQRTVHLPWVDLWPHIQNNPDQFVSMKGFARKLEVLTLMNPMGVISPKGDARGVRFLALPGADEGLMTHMQVGDIRWSTWQEPVALPKALEGRYHSALKLTEGRVLILFVDGVPTSPTFGDLVLWSGTFEDLLYRREGKFTARLMELGEMEATPWTEFIRKSGGFFEATFYMERSITKMNWRRRQFLEGSSRLTFRLEDIEALLPARAPSIPLVDLDQDPNRHVVVDREEGQYLGHVTTELLDDGKTILAVYPKGHGKGGIVYKRSEDGGLTWSDRLPTPDSWATSREVPTLHQVVDPQTGDKRLIMWSGLYPSRLSHSSDEGASWSELEPVGSWGGIVVMGFVERLSDGRYLAMFHDDGRFFSENGHLHKPVVFTLYQTISSDGGLTWADPTVVWTGSDLHLCEPGCIRSPDGKTLAVLLRENSRRRNSHIVFSNDEGATWSAPRELPASLTGDRHTPAYGPDGRLFICFRDTALESPTQGDWVGWVGTWEDLVLGTSGQYRIRFKDNLHRWDTTYPGVELLPDGTFVATTYGHWEEGAQPYILSARFTLEELDARVGK